MPQHKPHTPPINLRLNARLLASATALAGLAHGAAAQDRYEFVLIPAQSASFGGIPESWLDQVNDAGVATGVMTYTETLPSGSRRTTMRDFSWTRDGGAVVDDPLTSAGVMNNLGDRASSGDFGRVFFTDGTIEIISPFPGDVALFAQAMSDTGMVVGYSRRQGSISRGIPREAFYWTRDTGIVAFRDDVPEAANVQDANTAGEIVGITSNGLFADNKAFYYDTSNGEHVDLHAMVSPAGTGPTSTANSINDDGLVVGVRDNGPGDVRAFQWSADTGLELLPMSWANAVNNQGTIVGGRGRYTPDRGVEDLFDLADISVDFFTFNARDISDTGIIVGSGRLLGDSAQTAFALFPIETCPADIDGDGELTLFDFLEFQNLFDAGDPAADFDGDGELTLFDFLAFQNQFDAGC